MTTFLDQAQVELRQTNRISFVNFIQISFEIFYTVHTPVHTPAHTITHNISMKFAPDVPEYVVAEKGYVNLTSQM